MKKITIINACTELGVSVNGASQGPIELTKNLNNENIEEIITLIANNENKEYEKENRKKNLEELKKYNNELYNKTKEVINKGNFPLTLGGDHSLAVATVLASSTVNGKIGVIWIDAHGDFNTFDTTITGNIHGLPLAAITGYEQKELTEFNKENYIDPKNTVIVGGRDIDPLEIENIKEAGVTLFTTEDIKKYGMKEIMSQSIEIASNGTEGIHISYDLDVIDPKFAPGVSIPAINGISIEEAYEALESIIENNDKVKSLDLIEFNPNRDVDNKTEEIALKILNDLINNI